MTELDSNQTPPVAGEKKATRRTPVRRKRTETAAAGEAEAAVPEVGVEGDAVNAVKKPVRRTRAPRVRTDKGEAETKVAGGEWTPGSGGARESEARQPEARQPEARQPEARQPEARQPEAGESPPSKASVVEERKDSPVQSADSRREERAVRERGDGEAGGVGDSEVARGDRGAPSGRDAVRGENRGEGRESRGEGGDYRGEGRGDRRFSGGNRRGSRGNDRRGMRSRRGGRRGEEGASRYGESRGGEGRRFGESGYVYRPPKEGSTFGDVTAETVEEGAEAGVVKAPAARQEGEDPVVVRHETEYGEGVVEISGKGFGFLRLAERNFTQSPLDIFVTPEVIRKHGVRDGMWLRGEVRRGNRGLQLFKLTEVEGAAPEQFTNLPHFEDLTVINPIEQLKMETRPERFTTRVIDMMTPVGKGQRGLIVAPPRTGKTTLLQHIAEAMVENHPDVKLIILLVDERPEEVTEISRAVSGAEIMASSNDSDVKSHTHIAQLAIERAKRLVEAGRDVFILLDSITRVGRAFNNATVGNGRTLSGGMDARAMEVPRRLFAAARNTEEAGSLTILGTALIETGSRMDDLIFQEFKGTGNMELVLDRRIAELRIYPAVDIFASGTRREELLIPAHHLEKINVIRRGLADHKPAEAIERLLSFLAKFPTNEILYNEIPG